MKIKAVNTLAWGNKPVEIDFINQGLTLIKGKNLSSKAKSSNGVGKSTILNTLLYARYGVYPDGFKKADVINEDAKGNSLVEYWETKNGKEAYIVRGIKCEEMNFNGIDVVGDFLLFFVDGKDMRGDVSKVTQAHIDTFLGVDLETFLTAALFSAADESLASKTSGKQDEVFSKIMHLEGLEEARLRVRDRQKEVKIEISNCDHRIETLESHIVRENQRLEQVSNALKKWEIKHKEDLEDLQYEFERAKANKIELESAKFLAEEEVENAKEVLEDYEEELNEFDEESLRSNKEECKKTLRAYDTDLGGIKYEIRKLKSEIKQAQSMNGVAICDKCFHEIDEDYLYSVIEEKNNALDSASEKYEEVENKRLEVAKRLQKAETELGLVNSTRNKIVSQNSLINRLETRVNSYTQKISSEVQNITRINKAIDRKEAEEPPQSESAVGIEAEIVSLEDKIAIENANKNKLLTEVGDLDFCLKMYGPQGIRNLLIKSIIPELNNAIVKYADILTNGELTITFTGETEVGTGRRTSTRNKMQIKAVDRYGSEKYAKMSAGEKRRVDLCVALGMNQLLSTRVGLPFLATDEIFASVDGRGKEKIMELLEYMKTTIPSIFVISNQDDVISESFDNIWTVIREGKQSRIEFS